MAAALAAAALAGVGAGAVAGRDLVRDCASIGGKYQLTRLQAALRAVAPDCCGVFVRADPRLRQTQCDCSRPQTDDLCRAICCCLDALPIVRPPPPAPARIRVVYGQASTMHS